MQAITPCPNSIGLSQQALRKTNNQTSAINIKKIKKMSRSPKRKQQPKLEAITVVATSRDDETRRKMKADWKMQFATGTAKISHGYATANQSPFGIKTRTSNKREVVQFLQTHGFSSTKDYHQFQQQVSKNKKRIELQRRNNKFAKPQLDDSCHLELKGNVQNIEIKINEMNVSGSRDDGRDGIMALLETDSNKSINLPQQDSIFFSQSKLRYFEKSQRLAKQQKIISGLLSPVIARRPMLITNQNTGSQPIIQKPQSQSPFRPVQIAKNAGMQINLAHKIPKIDTFSQNISNPLQQLQDQEFLSVNSKVLREKYKAPPIDDKPLRKRFNDLTSTNKSNVLSEFLAETSIKSTDGEATATVNGSIYQRNKNTARIKHIAKDRIEIIKSTDNESQFLGLGSQAPEDNCNLDKLGIKLKKQEAKLTKLPRIDQPSFVLEQAMDYRPPHQLTMIHNYNMNQYSMKLRKKNTNQIIPAAADHLHVASASKIPSRLAPFQIQKSPSPVSNFINPDLVMISPSQQITANNGSMRKLSKANKVYSTSPFEKGGAASSHTASNYNKNSHFQSDQSLVPPFKKSEFDLVLDQVPNTCPLNPKQQLVASQNDCAFMQPQHQDISGNYGQSNLVQPDTSGLQYELALPTLKIIETTPNQTEKLIKKQYQIELNKIKNIKEGKFPESNAHDDQDLSGKLSRLHRHDSNINRMNNQGGTPFQVDGLKKDELSANQKQLHQTSKQVSQIKIENPLVSYQAKFPIKKVIQLENAQYDTIHGMFPMRKSYQNPTKNQSSPKMSEQHFRVSQQINGRTIADQIAGCELVIESNQLSRLKTHLISTENIMSELEKQYEKESIKTKKAAVAIMNTTFQPQQQEQQALLNSSDGKKSPNMRPSLRLSKIDQIIKPVAEGVSASKNNSNVDLTDSHFENQRILNKLSFSPIHGNATVYMDQNLASSSKGPSQKHSQVIAQLQPCQFKIQQDTDLVEPQNIKSENQIAELKETESFGGGSVIGLASMPDLLKGQKLEASQLRKQSMPSDPSVSGAVLFGRDGQEKDLKKHGVDEERVNDTQNRHSRVLQILNKNLVIHLVDESSLVNRHNNKQYLNIYNLQEAP